jgi:hypothetical protein
LGKEKLGGVGGAHRKRADGGGARMKSSTEEGSPVVGAGETDAWVVGKWGRSLSSGVAKRRTAKGEWMAVGVCFE